MSKNSNYFFLFILAASVIFPKWILTGIYFDSSSIVSTIFNTDDIQYFPIIINFSDFILNPSYLENINENKVVMQKDLDNKLYNISPCFSTY